MCVCVPHLQRVLVQATGSSQKGAQVQQLPVPRVQQVPQQVHTHTHTVQSIKPCTLTAHAEDPQHLWLIFCLSTYLFRSLVTVLVFPSCSFSPSILSEPRNADMLYFHASHAWVVATNMLISSFPARQGVSDC